MGVFDLFSKRQKRRRGEDTEVLQYQTIPQKLRNQIIHILLEVYGEPGYSSPTQESFRTIHTVLCKEYGCFALRDGTPERKGDYRSAIFDFISSCDEAERVLDTVELCFWLAESYQSDYNVQFYARPSCSAEEGIKELNARFLENGVGFQFQSGEIIRVDSLFVHTEAVKPALTLLTESRFQGVNEEFLKAHEHYRHGRYKECLNECLKSFESMMKAICDQQRWPYAPNATSSQLIQVCFDNGLIQPHLQSHFGALRSLLESGVPTIRNRQGAHGQGPQPVTIPHFIAAYQLHLTASTIVFLGEAEKDHL